MTQRCLPKRYRASWRCICEAVSWPCGTETLFDALRLETRGTTAAVPRSSSQSCQRHTGVIDMDAKAAQEPLIPTPRHTETWEADLWNVSGCGKHGGVRKTNRCFYFSFSISILYM